MQQSLHFKISHQWTFRLLYCHDSTHLEVLLTGSRKQPQTSSASRLLRVVTTEQTPARWWSPSQTASVVTFSRSVYYACLRPDVELRNATGSNLERLTDLLRSSKWLPFVSLCCFLSVMERSLQVHFTGTRVAPGVRGNKKLSESVVWCWKLMCKYLIYLPYEFTALFACLHYHPKGK